MTLQEKLKAATQSEHDQLEQLMYVSQIMSKTLTLEQYKTILATNYAIHSNYESKLFSLVPVEIAGQLKLENREKLPALEKDVLQADLKIDSLTEPDKINWTSWSALGALYVLEGATMGGKVIYKQLLANPNFKDKKLDLEYYNIYGDQLMPTWVAFVAALNTTPEEHHNEVVEGAKMMFKEIAAIAKTSAK